MTVITYQVELLEPCLVTALEGDPNSAVAFDYLPGAVVRGALINRYLWRQREAGGDSALDVTSGPVRDMFFNGRTCYLNGYPLVKKQRALPVPASWQVEKGKEDKEIYDFAVEDAAALYPEKEWKGIKKPFALLDEENAYPLEVERQIAIHIARDRHPNREKKREPNRAVFRYDALAAGQTFAAAIVCPDQETADTLAALLPDVLSLGGSRSGGYGRVRIHTIQIHDPWRELPGAIHTGAEFLTVTLLSDALIRDENGQFAANKTAVTRAVAAKLGCDLTLEAAYYQTTYIGGFNRKWGLPLPQTIAVKMGAVFVFQKPDCPPGKLRELEVEGIGERRLDGFGRVGVNWHAEPELNQSTLPETTATAVTLRPDTSAGVMAQKIANRLLRQKLDARLDERAGALGSPIRGIEKSQLYALRQAIHEARLQEEDPQAGCQLVRDYLDHALTRQTSRQQLEKARVEGQELHQWLKNRLEDAAAELKTEDEREIWQANYLQVKPLPQIGGISAELTPRLAYEYTLRLMADVLSRAAQAAGKGGQNERR